MNCARANITVKAKVGAQVKSCKSLNNKATVGSNNRVMSACNSANYKKLQAK